MTFWQSTLPQWRADGTNWQAGKMERGRVEGREGIEGRGDRHSGTGMGTGMGTSMATGTGTGTDTGTGTGTGTGAGTGGGAGTCKLLADARGVSRSEGVSPEYVEEANTLGSIPLISHV